MPRLNSAWVIVAVTVIVYHNNQDSTSASATGVFSWMPHDQFDEINDHISSIDATNCRNKDKSDLQLRKDIVSDLPVYNNLLSRVWYQNRTSLIHIHNMALNRAFFYSYVLQRMNSSSNFYKQPNWMYFFFSGTADVNANPNILNGSSLYFDNDCHYPNWYTTLAFNKTLPLFAPKVFRHDDFGDQGNFLREPTRTTALGVDAGSGRFMNYTRSQFKMNPWYANWLPDLKGDMDSLTKFTYYIGIKESNVTGQFTKDSYENFAFFGPNSPSATTTDERELPVQFTAPYFDCGGSNKWVVSAVAPVVDFMPRYTNWTRLRRQRIVGVTVTDIDLMEVDFNACDVGVGNRGPSYLSGIHKCPKYSAVSYLGLYHQNTFLIDANRASHRPNMSRVTQALRDDVIQMRQRHQQRFHANQQRQLSNTRRKRAAIFDNQSFDKMMRLMRWKNSVTRSTCQTQPNHRLMLPGDVGYGASTQFENEGRTALRLSNFISLYLQNVMPDENFGNLRGGGPLHKDMMFGEVIANVMGNYRIYSAGVYFDRWKFENDDGSRRELFGPWAFRRRGAYFAEDAAGYSRQYVDSDWFRQAKARHGANFIGTTKYKLRTYVRSNPEGTSRVRHEFFPITYRAAPYEVGFWTKPHFRCDGKVDAWVMTYVSPFFGLDSLRTKLEFRGVTTVDVPLSFLELNQCPMPYSVPNAFKNTARCDYFSTNCKARRAKMVPPKPLRPPCAWKVVPLLLVVLAWSAEGQLRPDTDWYGYIRGGDYLPIYYREETLTRFYSFFCRNWTGQMIHPFNLLRNTGPNKNVTYFEADPSPDRVQVSRREDIIGDSFTCVVRPGGQSEIVCYRRQDAVSRCMERKKTIQRLQSISPAAGPAH
ncbi:hypothetical protein EGW08_021543 [Elysia chlorotica]|uniref:GPR158/179 extracellular domain-containing protein n=1 Tax=Elysia chlorotica TaxID=188477 RepID=A0A3S1AYS0_ELYCH|nr:hypothetical protein EGW08_021543 [Elysia chlorotica]